MSAKRSVRLQKSETRQNVGPRSPLRANAPAAARPDQLAAVNHGREITPVLVLTGKRFGTSFVAEVRGQNVKLCPASFDALCRLVVARLTPDVPPVSLRRQTVLVLRRALDKGCDRLGVGKEMICPDKNTKGQYVLAVSPAWYLGQRTQLHLGR